MAIRSRAEDRVNNSDGVREILPRVRVDDEVGRGVSVDSVRVFEVLEQMLEQLQLLNIRIEEAYGTRLTEKDIEKRDI